MTDLRMPPAPDPVNPGRVGLDAPAEVFRKRRERFLDAIGDGVAILPASPELFRSGDSEHRYRPNSDLHYLTGFAEPETVALLTPHDPEYRLTLFVRARDPEKEAWTGARAGVEGARERFGADAAYPIAELDERLEELLRPADRVLYALGADRSLDRTVIALLQSFRRSRVRSGEGPTGVEDPGTVLHPMRRIKDDFELMRMRQAAGISAAAHRAAMGALAPGRGEWEVEAILEMEFRTRGGAGPAFAPIVAAGVHGTVLHYVHNDGVIGPDDLVLIDAGAELGMYAADITRTTPASGRFTPEQRAVYEVVLAAEEAAIEAVEPGSGADDPHQAALRVLVEGMVELGLLEGPPEDRIEDRGYRKFFMHRTSHWLGMDVHDVGAYVEDGKPVTLRPGMVLTIEPGIYISPHVDGVPEALRGIGVRIEDDVEVTGDGHRVTTRGVPVAPDEIEALVGGWD